MGLREDVDEAQKEIEKLKDDVADLKRFRSWIMGIAAGVGGIIAFFAEGLRKKLGL